MIMDRVAHAFLVYTVVYFRFIYIVITEPVDRTASHVCRIDSCKPNNYLSFYLQNATFCLDSEHFYNFQSVNIWNFSVHHILYNTFPIDPIKENYVRKVENVLFSVVKPTPFKTNVSLVLASVDVIVSILNIDSSWVQRRQFIDLISGAELPKGSIPLAHRYGGHQFGYWSDQLGDGRAVLLGEHLSANGDRWELQLKGSGLTPYSRQGDGRAVLRSSIREFLCSEAMHYLGMIITVNNILI